jgi:hypothetical protein
LKIRHLQLKNGNVLPFCRHFFAALPVATLPFRVNISFRTPQVVGKRVGTVTA